MIKAPKLLTSSTSQACWMNTLVRRSQQQQSQFSKGLLASITTRGTSLLAANRVSAASGETIIATFKIVAIYDNALTCHTYDGITEGSSEYSIAKPWTLRRYVYEASTGSVTYTYVNSQRRTATDGSITETQDITKRYELGEMVIAANITTRRSLGGGASESWEWLDLNMDGRDWARAAE